MTLSMMYPRIPLKDMESGALVMELFRNTNEIYEGDPMNRDMVFSAAQLATHLHRDQTRSARAGFPRTPYIEHPMRNTLRLMRWGFTDAPLLAGSLLHDVPEDCAKEIATKIATGPQWAEKKSAGVSDVEIALGWLQQGYGREVGETVRLVTTPEWVEQLPSGPERNEAYTNHLAEATVTNWRATVVKIGDVSDNGGSLRHQLVLNDKRSRATTWKRMDKYEPAVGLLAKAVGEHPEVSPTQAALMTNYLDRMTDGFSQMRQAILNVEPVIESRMEVVAQRQREHDTQGPDLN